MLHSPGTNRNCCIALPGDTETKLGLLGLRVMWEGAGWTVYPEGCDKALYFVSVGDEHTWPDALTYLADLICRDKHPRGWGRTQKVDSVAIPAASVIDEENFHER
jgi:hypothetical protein